MSPLFRFGPLGGGLAALCVAALIAVAGARLPDETSQPLGSAPGGSLLTYRAAARDPRPLLRAPATLTAGDLDWRLGRQLLGTDWRTRPPVEAALGPHFDQPSCLACHVEGLRRAGARRARPLPVVRLLHPADLARSGAQINTDAVAHVSPQGRLVLRWEEQAGRFADGTPYQLRRPRAEVLPAAGTDGPIGPVALRMPPALFGWGLLEAVPEGFLRNLADPQDANGNGISGRLHRVLDLAEQRFAVGRFGWKAEQPTLRQQTAAALFNDMGITTTLFPGSDCAASRTPCVPELDDERLDLLVHAQRYLGVPDRRGPADPVTVQGRRVFEQLGCAFCHLQVMITDLDDDPDFADQVVWPYTDLLLHDMGEGLSDPPLGPDDALAREWRTAPLWGIGLMAERFPNRGFLHDGRARDLMEAILWHGGEAAAARDRTLALDAQARMALLAFLESL
jgi:CxxC motif-containing protein (DUF1111 family)